MDLRRIRHELPGVLHVRVSQERIMRCLGMVAVPVEFGRTFAAVGRLPEMLGRARVMLDRLIRCHKILTPTRVPVVSACGAYAWLYLLGTVSPHPIHPRAPSKLSSGARGERVKFSCAAHDAPKALGYNVAMNLPRFRLAHFVSAASLVLLTACNGYNSPYYGPTPGPCSYRNAKVALIAPAPGATAVPDAFPEVIVATNAVFPNSYDAVVTGTVRGAVRQIAFNSFIAAALPVGATPPPFPNPIYYGSTNPGVTFDSASRISVALNKLGFAVHARRTNRHVFGSVNTRSHCTQSSRSRERLANGRGALALIRKPMKIVVVSDTHLPRFAARLESALDRVRNERPDLILHCGDLTTLDATAAFERIAPVEAVAGNNDGPEVVRRYGRRRVVHIGGAFVGMVHGDGAGGTTLSRARATFASEAVDAIVFGHSHIPYIALHGGVWLVNPGSVTDKRRQVQFSFGILETGALGLLPPRLVLFDAPPL